MNRSGSRPAHGRSSSRRGRGCRRDCGRLVMLQRGGPGRSRTFVLAPLDLGAPQVAYSPRGNAYLPHKSSQVVRCIQSCNKLHYSQLLRLRSDAAAGLLLASSYCTLSKLDPQKAPLRGA